MTVTEVVSEARAKLFAERKRAIAPKAVKTYAKEDITTFKKSIKTLAKSRMGFKESLDQTDKALKNLRHQLFEAEMQHTPITVLPPTGNSEKKSGKSDKSTKPKLSKKQAEKVIEALLKAKIINQEDLR